MLFDLLIVLAVAAAGLFVALQLFERVAQSAKFKKQKGGNKPKQAATPKKAAQTPKGKQEAPAAKGGKKAAPVAAEPEEEAPKYVQKGMSADRMVVLKMEDMKKTASPTTVAASRQSEFTKRQRERDESQGFKVIDSPVAPTAAPAKAQSRRQLEEIVSQREQFDRKLNAFFRAGDRKGKAKPNQNEKDENAPTVGGRVQMGKSGFSAKLWGEVGSA